LEQEFGERRLPVAFISRTLEGEEKDQHASYKELLAVALALQSPRVGGD
jgi:hypothetical protein